ncbi:MAG: citrate/2-methylcitrate synthase [Planctomyces sp.]|nr:citrate/2-methylcitrate synthase [Planctomyces sp.]
MAREFYHPGLRGVIAGETDICSLDDGLRYRGYCIYDLTQGASFLEVAYLLLFEQLPTEERLADFLGLVADEATIPQQLAQVLDLIPLHAGPLEALRTGISLLAHFDPQTADPPGDSGAGQAVRLLARLPLLLAHFARTPQSPPNGRRGTSARANGGPARTNGHPAADDQRQDRTRGGLRFDPSTSYAHNLFRLLQRRLPTDLEEHALETVLILAAEQEFTPSSFSARLAGSTQADIYSAVQAALSTFIGARHGGAERSVQEVFLELRDPADAASWVAERITAGEKIPGFGHPVFSDCDPRAAILEPLCCRLAAARNAQAWEDVAEAVEHAVWERQRLPPNIDWPLGRLLTYLGFARELHPALFACARVVGWCAHAVEQAESGESIRPRARYRGVERAEFAPLWTRDL